MSDRMNSMSFRWSGTAQPKVAPVLLLHGFLSSSARDWPDDRWAAPLAAAGRRVLLADLPAHGDAPDPAGPEQATVSALVDALADALRQAGEPADVVTYSLGARLAWSLAARHPDVVGRLVLGGLGPMDPFAALDFDAARRFAAGGTAPADPLTAMLAGMVVQIGDRVAARLDLMQGLAAEPFDFQAERPRAPALFLAGSEDGMCEGTGEIVSSLPGARLEHVPGDHVAALHHDLFRRHAFEFLGHMA